MQDDWKPGDLALCVRDDWLTLDNKPSTGPRKGAVREVRDTYVLNWFGGTKVLYLFLVGHPPDHKYIATAFRKIDPLTEEEEREFRLGLDEDRIRADTRVRIPFWKAV